MALDPRLLKQMEAVGIGLPSEGGGFQLGQREKRPGGPVPLRPYPGQGTLLSNQRKNLASNLMPELEDALKGIVETPFQETFGYSRAPIGNLVEPFFTVNLVKDLPFEHSAVYPILGDPKETDHFYRNLGNRLSSGKYPTVRADIQEVYSDLRRFNKDYRMVIDLGLARGPGFHAPTVDAAFKHGILLESMATHPEAANMGSVQRSNSIMRLHSQLAALKAKDVRAGGPLLAQAIQQYRNLIGPSVGLRAGRGVDRVLFSPTLTSQDPVQVRAVAVAGKGIREQDRADLRALISPQIEKQTPVQNFEQLEKFVKSNMEPEDWRILQSSMGPTSRMDPKKRAEVLIRELKSTLEFEGRYRVLADRALEDYANAGRPVKKVKSKPVGKQRLTKEAVEAGMISEETALKRLKALQRKMKPVTGGGPKNLALIMALAGILSAGFMAMNEQEA